MLATRLKADLALLLAAIVWGGGFVAQRSASAYLGAFAVNGLRFTLGTIVLLPLIRFHLKITREQFPWMILLGGAVFAGSALQQAGLAITSAANSGFITGLYVVIVPILLVLFGRQRLSWKTWISALVATIGIFLLSFQGTLETNPGDMLVLAGAVAWAIHLIVLGKLAHQMDILQLSIGQFLIAGVLNLAAGAIFELDTFGGIILAWPAIIYAGICSTAIGFSLQAIGQRNSHPADAAILLSMEAVFAALFGYLLLNERLSGVQIFGCTLILGSILLAQLNGNK